MFIRRFLFDPGNDVLLNIESVNILDLDPPAAIKGVGTGTVLCVGEFEDGAFASTQEVSGPDDFVSTWGQLGYTVGSVGGYYPSAVSRSADGALTAETWNGNGFVQLNGKKFARLLLCRVDTSVGSAQFTRLASVTGGAAFRYLLTTAQILSLTIGAVSASATFTGAAATVTGVAGTFNAFTGGETLTLGYDAAPNFITTFLSTDITNTLIATRINQYAGFTFCDVSGGQLRFTGIQKGTGGQVRIVAGASATTLGLTAATTTGTGNVQNIAAVSSQEVTTIVQAGISNTKVDVTPNGNLRVSATNGLAITVNTSTTAVNLGFTNGAFATAISSAGTINSTAGTFATLFGGGETITLGFDNAPDFVVTFTAGDQSQAQVIARINLAVAAYGFTMAASVSGTVTSLVGKTLGAAGQVRVVAASAGAVLTTLGFTVGNASGYTALAGSIPAGTLVTTANAAKQFVTMQTIPVTATSAGPYIVKVRHAVDDGTGLSATAGTVTSIGSPIAIGAFSVTNPQIMTACLTETQIDAAYVTAINTTKNINSVAKIANVTFSARQSNTIRRALRTNALDASAAGCLGRVTCIRPPLNTSKADAQSNTAEPGVGAYRDQRVIYNYIGANTFVPQIASRGLGGGTGFTADGNVDVGSDGWMASICSQLPPEENPGQETAFTGSINGIEKGSNVQNLDMNDYIAFKAAGISALRVDDGVAVFQSGCTSVDPLVFPNLVNISRRRMADFIQDTLAQRAKAFGKKLSTNARRAAMASEVRAFAEGLLSRKQPANQRIAGFTIDIKSGNTLETVGMGLYRIIFKVRTLASLDSIVIASTVGEQVVVQEILPLAA